MVIFKPSWNFVATLSALRFAGCTLQRLRLRFDKLTINVKNQRVKTNWLFLCWMAFTVSHQDMVAYIVSNVTFNIYIYNLILIVKMPHFNYRLRHQIQNTWS